MITVMETKSALESDKKARIKTAYPQYSHDERKEIREFLEAYCEIALQIFTRLQREKKVPVERRATIE